MNPALPEIQADLRRIRAQRRWALGAYVAALALFLAQLRPRGSAVDGELDLAWVLGFVGLLTGAVGAAALALGVPLLHGRQLAGALGLSLALMGLGLAAALDVHPDTWWEHGPMCFAFGTGISAFFMLVLGALSGRLWRRFPDPAAMIAIGTTAVGMLALHLKCPSTHAGHVLLFHLTPLAVLFVAARALSRLQRGLLEDAGQ
jgi:hypothetical protein